jgi:glycosyltransferase involved in cell wall biosynthesis
MFFIETGGPGGAERVVLELAKASRTIDVEPIVLTCREGWLTENLDAEKIERVRISSERSLDFGLPFRIAKEIKSYHADILHSHLLDSNFYGAFAAKIAGVPHLATEHGDVHHVQKKKYIHLKMRMLALCRSRFSAVSRFTADALEKLGIASERITVVSNPISLPDETNVDVRRKLRAELGVIGESDEHWLWIHVANFRPVKDQRTLIRGFARSREMTSLPQTLAIIGDGTLREELEREAAESVERENIHFLGFRENVSDWLCAGDGFILSSKSEALPMAVLEAGWSGLYLISSEVGGVPEILGSGRGGLFSPERPENLAQQIVTALTDRTATRRSAQALKEYVRETSASDNVISRYREIYKSLCE